MKSASNVKFTSIGQYENITTAWSIFDQQFNPLITLLNRQRVSSTTQLQNVPN